MTDVIDYVRKHFRTATLADDEHGTVGISFGGSDEVIFKNKNTIMYSRKNFTERYTFKTDEEAIEFIQNERPAILYTPANGLLKHGL
jgi:hypothetical protein